MHFGQPTVYPCLRTSALPKYRRLGAYSLANGSGAGVLESDADVMEYYGYAKNGYADGPGLMIRHKSIGSISYEGSFSKGRPDGTVRVSQSGRADKTRNYIDGKDQGASAQAAASPFDGLTGGSIN